MTYFRKEELARCFKDAGRCGECRLRQRAEKLPEGVEENLEALATNVLEPARQRLGRPIVVNSGYRCSIHNATVGGVTNSQHMRGEAADLQCEDNRKLARIIVEAGRFDQLIIYPTFVHVSYKRQGTNRRQILKKTPTGYQKISNV